MTEPFRVLVGERRSPVYVERFPNDRPLGGPMFMCSGQPGDLNCDVCGAELGSWRTLKRHFDRCLDRVHVAALAADRRRSRRLASPAVGSSAPMSDSSRSSPKASSPVSPSNETQPPS